jgi:hypothetical protein
MSMTSTCIHMNSSQERAAASQIRRAAGGKDLNALQRQIATGWTVDDLNGMASQDGKSAVHMAAWQGQITNLDYLLNLGCHVNAIATGEFSYGKTPIFFAATRSRKDVIEYLLDNGAHVKIVNNKGQSVLSIAASHVDADTIAKIQAAEAQQAHIPWTNYRKSHSDGLEYDDLDPRFLERPLRPTDVVTDLVINPTTKASRKGNFLRKNPEVVAREGKPRPRRTRGEKVHPSLSEDEMGEQKEAWRTIQDALEGGDVNGNTENAALALLIIVRLADMLRRPWIPQVAALLQQYAISSEIMRKIIDIARKRCETTKREANLLDKLMQHTTCDPNSRTTTTTKPTTSIVRQRREPIHVSSHLWIEARKAVSGLCAGILENEQCPILSLHTPPVWVNSKGQLEELIMKLTDEGANFVAVDTEWYTTFDSRVEVATLQIAMVRDEKNIQTWVIDMLAEDYIEEVAALVVHLFEHCTILAFAFGNDIDKLSSFVGQHLSDDRCLDLQPLAMQNMPSRSTPPGLQLCAACFISKDRVLCKREQCSDWAARPLREAQLNYAGLDAAVLLVLLAELQDQCMRS